MGPLLLDPFNFTPLSRTPWAGLAIRERIKAELIRARQFKLAPARIGESWECSCDPQFPSYIENLRFEGSDSAPSLLACLQRYPEAMLSQQLLRSLPEARCDILVKWIEASEPLSLQLHPADADPELKAHESGKPESWLVCQHATGAGVYLGFRSGVTLKQLQEVLMDGAGDPLALKALLYFHAVSDNDYFEIEPGIAHALAAGCTVLEPQRVLGGRSGVTYRMWDWGRRYNSEGLLDLKAGQARALHVEQCLKRVRMFADPEELLRALKKQAQLQVLRVQTATGRCELGVVHCFPANAYYKVYRLQLGAGQEGWRRRGVVLRLKGGYAIAVQVGGVTMLEVEAGDSVRLVQGQTAFLPAASFPLRFAVAEEAHVLLDCVVIVPAGAELVWDC